MLPLFVELVLMPRPWTDVTVQGMKPFGGVILYMGITVQPRLELYWTTKYPLNIHGVSDVMPINRFQQFVQVPSSS